jgi:hypothetical protein
LTLIHGMMLALPGPHRPAYCIILSAVNTASDSVYGVLERAETSVLLDLLPVNTS